MLGERGRFVLDGKRSDDAIVARLAPRFALKLIYYALGELEAKGEGKGYVTRSDPAPKLCHGDVQRS